MKSQQQEMRGAQRGTGRGAARGSFSRGRGEGGRGRGGFRGRGMGGRGSSIMAPPDTVEVLGEFTHSCEGFMICKSTNPLAPLINRPVYYEDKKKIGVVDEVFGPIHSFGFSVKLDEGIKVESFKPGLKVYANPMHLKSVTFFQPRPKFPKGPKSAGGPPIRRAPSGISKPRYGPPRGTGFSRGAPRGSRGFRGGRRGQSIDQY